MVEFWVLSKLARLVEWWDGEGGPKECLCGLPVPWSAFCGGCGRKSPTKPLVPTTGFYGDCGTCGRPRRDDDTRFCHWCGLSVRGGQ